MGCDMLVALGSAAVNHNTLFGMNLFGLGRQRFHVRRWPASLHSPGEGIRTAHVQLPQVRNTCTVLGLQAEGDWGLIQGCNEHQVAVGATSWQCRRLFEQSGLTGPDLVRLVLERSHSAVNAVDVLTDLIARHGHGYPRSALASAFAIADPSEGYVLEAAGGCWAVLECQEARAVADVGLIRQDWQRLSPGLAEHAIQLGWWQDDGTKLDFVGSLGRHDAADAWPLKRWGKATLALAQKSGSLDSQGLRRILLDQFDANVRRHELAPPRMRLHASLVISLDAAGLPLAWIARGSQAASVFFPLVVDADLPDALLRPISFQSPDAEDVHAHERAERLQAQFDLDAEELQAEARVLKQRNQESALRRLSQAMMQKHCEQWDAEGLRRPAGATASRREREETVPFFG